MKDTDYLYATMRVRVNENNLLSPQQKERMIDAKTPEEAVKVLSDAGYDDVKSRSLSDIEHALRDMRKKTMSLIGEISPDTSLCEVFALKYDFHNIKTIIKAELTNQEPERLLLDSAIVPKAELLSDIRSGDLSDLPPKMAEAITDAKETLSHTGDARLSDFILDRACFSMMADAARKAESEFLVGYVKLMCDAANLRAAVRCCRRGEEGEVFAQSFIPCGNFGKAAFEAFDFENAFISSPLENAAKLAASVVKGSGRMSEFEKELDIALMKYMEAARYASFDERPLVAYIAAREAEATAIRIIMSGKLSGISPDKIRERLRS